MAAYIFRERTMIMANDDRSNNFDTRTEEEKREASRRQDGDSPRRGQ